MVMARDFWFQALESQAVTSLCFVHCRPPNSSRFYPSRGDILETGFIACRWDRLSRLDGNTPFPVGLTVLSYQGSNPALSANNYCTYNRSLAFN